MEVYILSRCCEVHKINFEEARPLVSIRAMELETAKEILAEVLRARPGEIVEMIQMRLEESGPEDGRKGDLSCRDPGRPQEKAKWSVEFIYDHLSAVNWLFPPLQVIVKVLDMC